MKNKSNIINLMEIMTRNLTEINDKTIPKNKKIGGDEMEALLEKEKTELRVNGRVTRQELLHMDTTETRYNMEDEQFMNCDLSDSFKLFLEKRKKELENFSKKR